MAGNSIRNQTVEELWIAFNCLEIGFDRVTCCAKQINGKRHSKRDFMATDSALVFHRTFSELKFQLCRHKINWRFSWITDSLLEALYLKLLLGTSISYDATLMSWKSPHWLQGLTIKWKFMSTTEKMNFVIKDFCENLCRFEHKKQICEVYHLWS